MKTVILLLAVFSTTAYADLYKCPAPGGGTAYQETPCAKGGVKLDVQETKEDPVEAGYRRAASLGKVAVGMTQAEVRRAWGAPTKINRTVGNGYKSEQWIYDRGGIDRTQYVYFNGDTVTTVQTPVQK